MDLRHVLTFKTDSVVGRDKSNLMSMAGNKLSCDSLQVDSCEENKCNALAHELPVRTSELLNIRSCKTKKD